MISVSALLKGQQEEEFVTVVQLPGIWYLLDVLQHVSELAENNYMHTSFIHYLSSYIKKNIKRHYLAIAAKKKSLFPIQLWIQPHTYLLIEFNRKRFFFPQIVVTGMAASQLQGPWFYPRLGLFVCVEFLCTDVKLPLGVNECVNMHVLDALWWLWWTGIPSMVYSCLSFMFLV